MCLICVEYYYKRITKEELKKALPEMVMFAKNEEERKHYKKLQGLESSDDLEQEVKQHVSQFENKQDYKTSYKTRRI
ncbi:MAG: hypothetical protein ACXVLQ_09560 [Bacteriovorax sp.]